MKILIVDDDSDIRDLMTLELKKQGHEVSYAVSSEEAIESLRLQYIDLVFLDIVLGDNETSHRVVEYIYSTENTINSNIPIILMSAYMDEKYQEHVKGKKSKIHATLQKPFKKEDLSPLIDSLRYRDVLVLDDDEDILDLMASALKKKNFRMVRVKTAQEAMKAIETHRLICCFLDIVLENNKSSQEVFTFFDKMKSDKGVSLPVVVMSTYITDELKQQISKSKIEIHKVLEKPFSTRKIIDLVDEIEIKVSSRTQIDGGFINGTSTKEKNDDDLIKIKGTAESVSKNEIIETSNSASSREEYKDEVTHVKGSKADADDEKQVVKGDSTLQEKEHFTRVKEGATQTDENDFTRIKGDGENLDEAQRIKGSNQESDDLLIGNSKNEDENSSYKTSRDLDEKTNLEENSDFTRVKGNFDGSEVKDSMQVKSSSVVEEREHFSRIKGDGEAIDDTLRAKGGEAADGVISDKMTVKGSSESIDESPAIHKIKGNKDQADVSDGKMIAKGSSEASDETPDKYVIKGSKDEADVTEEKTIARGNKELANESKIAGMQAGKEGAEVNKVDLDNNVSMKQHSEKIDENEVLGSVKTGQEHNELAGDGKFKGELTADEVSESEAKHGFKPAPEDSSDANYKLKEGIKEDFSGDMEEHGAAKSNDNQSLNDSVKQKLAKQMEFFKKRAINERNEKGMTSLMIAARYGQIDTCRELIAAGAQTTLRSKSGKSAIHFAVMSLNLPTVHYFLQNGGKVNARDDKNVEPLYEAIVLGSSQMTKYLIDNGARTSARHNGQTYLMIAAQRGDVEIFKYLVESGLRIDQKDFKGNTAIDYAKKKKRREVLLYVKELLFQQKKAQ